MKPLKILFVALVLVGFFTGLWVTRAGGQTLTNNEPINVYAVKFLCGDFPPPTAAAGQVETGPVKPGDYQTAINIHNPNALTVPFDKKAVLMYTNYPNFPQGFEIPRPPGQLVKATLEEDWGMEIDCPDIRQVLLGNSIPTGYFIKGWVVIETPNNLPLNIMTVYTADGFPFNQTLNNGVSIAVPGGFSLEIDRATPTPGRLVLPTTTTTSTTRTTTTTTTSTTTTTRTTTTTTTSTTTTTRTTTTTSTTTTIRTATTTTTTTPCTAVPCPTTTTTFPFQTTTTFPLQTTTTTRPGQTTTTLPTTGN